MKNENSNESSSLVMAIVAGVIIAGLSLFVGLAFMHRSAPESTFCANAVSMSDSEKYIDISYKNGKNERRQADGKPLVITPAMEEALISEPNGTVNQFTKKDLDANSLELLSYDNTAFNEKDIDGGFQLIAISPQGRARTTEIQRDGKRFYVQWVFNP